MGRVELLAPAGNIDCFYAAMNAGADAVYMAGKSFGARASASNFTEEEFINCLHFAHINGRKIYLTLNTLIKEREWKELFSFVKPLYEEGLDGVIFQDLGLISFFKEYFPLLPLHASTQLTITEAASVRFLKEQGVCRVVPARELSLDEVKAIKDDTGIEVETFVHGALCYCYSGQCYFSSFLGGRSGNRGRCAGTCRLPYDIVKDGLQADSKVKYPLSLKDLCCINIIPELIDAGIDSFKIEGRLKSPEYVAGVTSIYRKAIDNYYEFGNTKITRNDIDVIEKLYLRSQADTGYYKQHNGRNMITLSDPSYNTQSEEMVKSIRDKLLSDIIKRPIIMKGTFAVNSPMEVEIICGDYSVICKGEVVNAANNKAATKEDIYKQLKKLGDSPFYAEKIDINLGENCFLPVKQLNELRRNAVSELEEKILVDFRRKAGLDIDYTIDTKDVTDSKEGVLDFSAVIADSSQLNGALSSSINAIYIPYDLIYESRLSEEYIATLISNSDKNIKLILPRIIRKKDTTYMTTAVDFIKKYKLTVLVRNLESLEILKENGIYDCELDYTIYNWNKSSLSFLNSNSIRRTAPIELSGHQIDELDDRDVVIPVYGHIPFMVSANCIKKTGIGCDKGKFESDLTIKDRYKKEHFVRTFCLHCYNEIYNGVPNSYHKYMDELIRKGYHNFRLDFTVEDSSQVSEIIDYFIQKNGECPIKEYTTGHYEKGAI